MVHRCVFVHLSQLGVIPAPLNSGLQQYLCAPIFLNEENKSEKSSDGSTEPSSIGTTASFLTSQSTFICCTSECGVGYDIPNIQSLLEQPDTFQFTMDDYIHLNDFYQQQISWLRTLTPEQLGIQKKYSYPGSTSPCTNSQASSCVDAEIRRGSYFTSRIQFPSTHTLPLSLKNSETPGLEGQLILEAHLDERIFNEEGIEVQPFKEAIEVFQHMNDIITPADMCYCLTDTVEIIYSLANYYERMNVEDVTQETKSEPRDDTN